VLDSLQRCSMGDADAEYLTAAADDERSPAAILADQAAINDRVDWNAATFLPDDPEPPVDDDQLQLGKD
jgi:hypothetical protein